MTFLSWTLLLSGIKKENDAGCSFSNFVQKSLQNKKPEGTAWWQNIPLTDYKPKQHILFRINTNNDYKVSIILYVGEIKKMHKILYYIDIKIGYVVE